MKITKIMQDVQIKIGHIEKYPILIGKINLGDAGTFNTVLHQVKSGHWYNTNLTLGKIEKLFLDFPKLIAQQEQEFKDSGIDIDELFATKDLLTNEGLIVSVFCVVDNQGKIIKLLDDCSWDYWDILG